MIIILCYFVKSFVYIIILLCLNLSISRFYFIYNLFYGLLLQFNFSLLNYCYDFSILNIFITLFFVLFTFFNFILYLFIIFFFKYFFILSFGILLIFLRNDFFISLQLDFMIFIINLTIRRFMIFNIFLFFMLINLIFSF